jgi:PIN domain nuclease of toxin-antitoxin system
LKFLLDSNVLLWAVFSPGELTEPAKAILRGPENELAVSHASLWELLGKIGRGRLLLAGTSVEAALQQIIDFGVTFLPVELSHIVAAALLPHHHQDPFDRVIIAQAIDRGLPVLTSDGTFELYDITVVWK